MIKAEFKSHIAATGQLRDMRYLKPSQVPKVYPISHARLYDLLNQGHIKSVKLGSARLVSVDSIEASSPVSLGTGGPADATQQRNDGQGTEGHGRPGATRTH